MASMLASELMAKQSIHLLAWMGSVGGSVGRVVAPDTRDLRCEFQRGQNFIYQFTLK